MAKLEKTKVESQSYDYNFSYINVILTGLIVGLLSWLFVGVLDYYINSLNTVSNLVSVIVAVAGLALLLRFRTAKAVLVVIAAALSLWGLGLWLDGLAWYEMLLYSCLLYAAAYFVFAWMARVKNIYLAFTAIALTVVIVRLTISL